MLGSCIGDAIDFERGWIPLAEASLADCAIFRNRVAPEEHEGELLTICTSF